MVDRPGYFGDATGNCGICLNSVEMMKEKNEIRRIQCDTDLSLKEALVCAQKLEQFLTEQGVYFTISKCHEPGLRFIKIEASIRIKPF